MYNTSQKWKENIYKNVQSILNIYIDDKLINPDYILDFKVGQTLFEENLELGSTTSKYIEFKIYKDKMPQNMKKVKVDYGIKINESLKISEVNTSILGTLKGIKVRSLTGDTNGYEIIPIGIFNVDEYKDNDDNTLTIKCIDNMSKFEFKYDGSTLTYPATLLEVLKAICSKAGVELGSVSFLNSDKKIAVYDNTVSAREYISYIAESAGGFAFAGRDGKLYIRNIYQDEQEVSLELFGSYKWGEEYQISKVSYEDGVRSFKFGNENRNNLWINQENMFIVDEDQIQKIYKQVNGLTANCFEGKTIIDPALDVGDKIVVNGKAVIYQGELNYQTRFIADIKSTISTKQKQETTVQKESQKVLNRRIQSNIDQIEGKITQLVQETTEHEEKLTKHEQTMDSITDKVSNMADLTRSIEGIRTISLENCIKGNLLELHIKGNNTVFESLKLSDNLYLSDDLYLKGDSLIVIKDQNGKSKEYELNIQDTLRQNGTVYDEYILKEGKAQVIRRINADGTIKDKAVTESLGTVSIMLEEGNNTLSIKNYTAEISAKWAIKSEYSEVFATNVKMDSEIKQTAQEIKLSVNKKLEDYSTTTEMNSEIKQTAQEIKLSVNEKLESYDTSIQVNSKLEETSSKISLETSGKINTLEKNINAKIELKVDTKNLISEINASADKIALKGNRISITSDKFKLTDNGEVSVKEGNFKVVANDGKKLIDFSESGIRFYNNNGKEIGGLVSTQEDNGYLFLSLHNGVSLNISKTSSDGTYFTHVFSFKDIDDVPYIRNTASGTLFSKAGGGITVENGLITKWNLSLLNIELKNITITGIKVVDGMIYNITYQQN